MRIAIPVDQAGAKAAVATSFGRAANFLLYETDTKESSVIENSALTNPGGAGIKAAQIVVDSGANAVLTPRCGENAALVLEGAGIALWQTNSPSVQENIERFRQGKLSRLKDIHAGLSYHGGE